MGKLSALAVKNLKEPGRYSDGEGLILKLAAQGRGSWLLRVQVDGKRRDIGIGTLADLSLSEARDSARAIRKQIRAGVDVIAERKKKADLIIPTFREAAKTVHGEHKAAWKNGKHQDQWINTLETYAFPLIGNRLVSEVEGPAIRDVLAPIWLTKPETARRVRQRIAAVLDWACAKGLRATEAPLRSVNRGLPRQPRKNKHFDAMPFSEVPAFMSSVHRSGQRLTVSPRSSAPRSIQRKPPVAQAFASMPNFYQQQACPLQVVENGTQATSAYFSGG